MAMKADRQTQTNSKSEQKSLRERERERARTLPEKFTDVLKEILLAYKFSNISHSEPNEKVATTTVDFLPIKHTFK